MATPHVAGAAVLLAETTRTGPGGSGRLGVADAVKGNVA